MTTVAILGWIGAALILSAYALLTLNKLKSKSPAYHVMNLVGAALVAYNTFLTGAYGPAFLNAAWFGIALCGLLRR